MKKIALICWILCIAVLLSCAPPAVLATESTDPGQTEGFPAGQDDVPFGSLSTTSGCRTINGTIPLGGSDRMLETAQAAFVYECNTETVVYGYNPDLRLRPGSLLKMVTALIAVERCSMTEEVTVNTNAISHLPYGAINVKLKNGEVLSMSDVLHFMIMSSANDAAIVIAEHVAGSEAVFVELMNTRLKEMGCTNTTVLNCHGLDRDGQYTTARDMARFMKTAMENEKFRELIGTTKYKVPPTNKNEKEREIITENHLIYAAILPQFVDSRVIGGMPSYTSADTGASIAFAAEDDDGMSFVYVIMGTTRTFNEKSGNAKYYGNFEEALDLLAYSFDGYHIREVLYDGQALNQFPVSNGECDVVAQPNAGFTTLLPAKVHMKDLRFDYNPVGGGFYAPIESGAKIATVNVWYLSSCLTQAELYAMNPVRPADDSGVKIHGLVTNESGGAGLLAVLGGMLMVGVGVVGIYLGYNHFRRYLRRSRRRRRRASRRRSY